MMNLTVDSPITAVIPCNGLTRTGRRITCRLHLEHLSRVLVARAMQARFGLAEDTQ
jgi:hypothetical protein